MALLNVFELIDDMTENIDSEIKNYGYYVNLISDLYLGEDINYEHCRRRACDAISYAFDLKAYRHICDKIISRVVRVVKESPLPYDISSMICEFHNHEDHLLKTKVLRRYVGVIMLSEFRRENLVRQLIIRRHCRILRHLRHGGSIRVTVESIRL